MEVRNQAPTQIESIYDVIQQQNDHQSVQLLKSFNDKNFVQ